MIVSSDWDLQAPMKLCRKGEHEKNEVFPWPRGMMESLGFFSCRRAARELRCQQASERERLARHAILESKAACLKQELEVLRSHDHRIPIASAGLRDPRIDEQRCADRRTVVAALQTQLDHLIRNCAEQPSVEESVLRPSSARPANRIKVPEQPKIANTVHRTPRPGVDHTAAPPAQGNAMPAPVASPRPTGINVSIALKKLDLEEIAHRAEGGKVVANGTRPSSARPALRSARTPRPGVTHLQVAAAALPAQGNDVARQDGHHQMQAHAPEGKRPQTPRPRRAQGLHRSLVMSAGAKLSRLTLSQQVDHAVTTWAAARDKTQRGSLTEALISALTARSSSALIPTVPPPEKQNLRATSAAQKGTMAPHARVSGGQTNSTRSPRQQTAPARLHPRHDGTPHASPRKATPAPGWPASRQMGNVTSFRIAAPQACWLTSSAGTHVAQDVRNLATPRTRISSADTVSTVRR